MTEKKLIAGTKTTPRIAVILATYNGELWIQELLASVLAQVGVDVNVYISDDGSTDSTLAILKEWSQRDCRVRILASERKFGSAGQNFFWAWGQLKGLRFDALAFADQDDIWIPSKLSKQYSHLLEGYDGVSSNVLAFWPNNTFKVINNATALTEWDYVGQAAGQGCTYLISPRLCELYWSAMDRFDLFEIVHHDWFIYALARAAGLKWFIEKQSLVLYRQHGANEVGSRGTWQGVLARLKKVQSGWYKKQILAQLKIIKTLYPNHDRDIAVAGLYSAGRVARLTKLLSVLPFRRDKGGKFMFLIFFMLGWV
ncbi:glycosyltransferase [Pigmentiphaga daeguensis]|uniref:Glycosyltransferase family 2 protein n=1 Tax=Pigmentiphaga daeguensis TaxID=414049 RepID=A0ABP3N5U1_9BURK